LSRLTALKLQYQAGFEPDLPGPLCEAGALCPTGPSSWWM
jgi:hypothetical protein